MAPKPSIKKSPSPEAQPQLGPPYPCLPTVSVAPKSTPEQKPRMLRPSDSPFDPTILEVSRLLVAGIVCHCGVFINCTFKVLFY